MPARSQDGAGIVYLLHFLAPHAHARHYLGIGDRARVDRLLHGEYVGQSQLVHAVCAGGASFIVARLWTRDQDDQPLTWRAAARLQQSLKKAGSRARWCPVCVRARRVEWPEEDLCDIPGIVERFAADS